VTEDDLPIWLDAISLGHPEGFVVTGYRKGQPIRAPAVSNQRRLVCQKIIKVINYNFNLI
jgi:hypothetical protein